MNHLIMRTLDHMPEKSIVNDLGWEAFLRYKVASYQSQNQGFRRRFPLIQYLGMTQDEYADWSVNGVISDRVKKGWA